MPKGQKEKSRARPKPKPGAKNIAPLAPVNVPAEPDRHGLDKFRPEFIDQAAYMCTLGATDMELARWFGVDVVTLHNWKYRYPEFAQGLKAGKAAADDRVERSLYMNAVGYTYEMSKPIVLKDADGAEHIEIATWQETQPPITAAQIFWLKNRRKDIWRDVHQLEHGRPGEFESLTDIDLAKRMAEAASNLAKLQKQLKKDKDDE